MNANDIYCCAMSIFTHADTEDIYDVDMFITNICNARDWEAEKTPIDSFSTAVVMLIREDTLLLYYGFEGLSIIATELLTWAGQHLE